MTIDQWREYLTLCHLPARHITPAMYARYRELWAMIHAAQKRENDANWI